MVDDEVRVLTRAIDQAGDVLDRVHADQLSRPTPCTDWDVAAVVDHLVATPDRFLTMMRGEQPDWSGAAPHVDESWGPVFRVAGDNLIHAWHELTGDPAVTADWQTAELAVHTWDVATATGYPVDSLDPEVAERGLAFMRENLTADNRGPVFGAEQLAAFSGRSVG